MGGYRMPINQPLTALDGAPAMPGAGAAPQPELAIPSVMPARLMLSVPAMRKSDDRLEAAPDAVARMPPPPAEPVTRAVPQPMAKSVAEPEAEAEDVPVGSFASFQQKLQRSPKVVRRASDDMLVGQKRNELERGSLWGASPASGSPMTLAANVATELTAAAVAQEAPEPASAELRKGVSKKEKKKKEKEKAAADTPLSPPLAAVPIPAASNSKAAVPAPAEAKVEAPRRRHPVNAAKLDELAAGLLRGVDVDRGRTRTEDAMRDRGRDHDRSRSRERDRSRRRSRSRSFERIDIPAITTESERASIGSVDTTTGTSVPWSAPEVMGRPARPTAVLGRFSALASREEESRRPSRRALASPLDGDDEVAKAVSDEDEEDEDEDADDEQPTFPTDQLLMLARPVGRGNEQDLGWGHGTCTDAWVGLCTCA